MTIMTASAPIAVTPPVRVAFLSLCGEVPPLRGTTGSIAVETDVIQALLAQYTAEVLYVELLHQFAVRCSRHVFADVEGRLLPVSLARMRKLSMTGPISLKGRVSRNGRIVCVVIGGRQADGPWQSLGVVRVAPVNEGASDAGHR